MELERVSSCPLRVAVLPWKPRPGAHALTVICKATFELRPGESPLAAFQEPPWDTPSVTDMAPFKRRADVFAVGHAYPPQKSQKSVMARLVVGSLDKSAEICAEQGWLLVEGFGPLPPTAPSRMALLGEHAATWNHWTWSSGALPGNIDGGYFNVAPADQQLPELTGDERILLENLHPVHSRLETRLARVVPNATVERPNGETQDIRLRCDTLCIDTIRRIAMLVWRGVVLLESASEQGRIVVTAQPRVSSGSEAMLAVTAPVKADLVAKPVTPFSSSGGKEVDWAATTVLQHPVEPRPAVPFVPGPASLPPVTDVTPRRTPPPHTEGIDGDIAATRPLWYAGVATVLKPVTPFEKAQTPREIEVEAPPRFEGTAPLPPDDSGEEPPVRTAIEEPPMVGPIAVGPPATAIEGSDGKEVEPVAVAAPIANEARPPAELPLEQYAMIKAEIDASGTTRASVLHSHDLREIDWMTNDRRWRKAIDDEALDGEQELRERYDGTYVARVEALRGAIAADEYARIMVALERGRPKSALEALNIPHEALMPIVRLWTKKLARDGKVANEAMVAMRRARRPG